MLRRAVVELALLIAIAAAAGAAVNLLRRDRLPLAIPAAYYAVEPPIIPLLLPATRALYHDGKAVFVDARGADAYATGQIEGAFNVPLHDWQALYPELSSWIEGQDIVVYGDPGAITQATSLAGAILAEGHIRRAFVYVGSVADWRAAGLPVRAGSDPILGKGAEGGGGNEGDEP